MAGLLSDEEFARRLRQLTGDDTIWDENYQDFSQPDTDPDQAGGEEFAQRVQGVDWESDDSTEMILNVRHLSIKHRKKGDDQDPESPGHNGHSASRSLQPEDSLENADLNLWKQPCLALNEPSREGQPFTPWKIVRKYPYSFVGARSRELCEDFFKAEDICQGRVWDIYFLHHPYEPARKPYLFVPTEQFQHLLDTINEQLDLSLAIPAGSTNDLFAMSFGAHNTPRPRYLGRSTSHKTFQDLSDNIPPLDSADNLQDSGFLAKEDFISRLDMIHKAIKSSGKSKSEKNRQKRFENHKAWGQSSKRVQRYLGLRHKIYYPCDGTPIAPPKPLDLKSPMVHKAENSMVFIAIDIEAYEFDQNCITEVGVVTLDTEDIRDIAPGEGGKNWFPHIKARHLRIQENSWAVNRKFLKGCPNRFDFGPSEFVRKAHVPGILQEVIEARGADGQLRTTALVFHDGSQDVAYLEKLNFNIEAYPNVLEIVDTRNMHQHMVRGASPTKLESVLSFLEIPCQNLHNAGNDAAYTMLAMIGLAVKKRVDALDKYFGPIPYSELTANDEGWGSGGEETDGGLADRLRGPW
ncbi:hypothetical protein GQ53DRAFT_669307 [Thozetella sp. PMI_491]|nr:hypothetical protein GQ53DRAFT_669307 [Thozetella sp. PMI_491]